jgi:membrane-bound serine protease (ClpP class)
MAGMMLQAAAGLGAQNVGLIDIDGAIGPATAGYISRALEVAARDGDSCLIIRLDTPGGLLDSTKQIVRSFYEAKVPAIVYVAPSGACAGSAGTFITMAADVAAMAPHTTIGAAHPIEIGITGGNEQLDEVMKKKLENFTSSEIEAIAQKRGRNADWAKSAVLESSSITAEDALDKHVIDLIANDVPDLLRQLDGRKVGGHELKTAGATVVEIPMAAYERLFQMLWRPEVMLLLMLVTIYGILGEISHPGAILPGVAGALALVLFLYMSTILPVNTAALALVLLAVILFAVDLYSPTHGVLTAGGIIAFFLGVLMLFNRAGPAYHLPVIYVVTATAVTALFFLFVAGAGIRAQRLPVRAGRETMLGRITLAVAPIDAANGKVFVEGEYWNAVSDSPIAQDQPVKVVGIEGLTLKVRPAQGEPAPAAKRA